MALPSNDFVDEIEYLKLLTMMVIVSSCYHEKGIFQQSNELAPRNFFHELSPRTPAPDPQIALAAKPIHFWIAPRSLLFNGRNFQIHFKIIKLKSTTPF